MGWRTWSEEYGNFEPDKPSSAMFERTYLNKMARNVRNNALYPIRAAGRSTYSDYGLFYDKEKIERWSRPRGSGYGSTCGQTCAPRNRDRYHTFVTKKFPDKLTRKVTDTTAEGASGGDLKPTVLPPIGMTANSASGSSTSGATTAACAATNLNKAAPLPGILKSQNGSASSNIRVPDIQAVDVKLRTHDNRIIGFAPDLGRPGNYTYPPGTSSIKIPEIKAMTVSLNMKDGRRYHVDGIPRNESTK